MRWVGHVARMEVEQLHTGFSWGNLRERGHLEDPGLDGSLILQWIFRKWDVRMWTGSSWLKIGTGGPRKRGNEPSGSINSGELFD